MIGRALLLAMLVAVCAPGLLKADGAETAVEPARAIFATGCFWCTESDFEKLDGVIEVVSGYVGGRLANPTYEQVGSGQTGHTEAVEVRYDPARIDYATLVAHFWTTHDPFDADGQFCDRGPHYRPGIFYLDAAQKRLAEAGRQITQDRFEQPIVTEITAATRFWPAEEYHQDYYKKNPLRYRYYRHGCGRDARLRALWDEARPAP